MVDQIDIEQVDKALRRFDKVQAIRYIHTLPLWQQPWARLLNNCSKVYREHYIQQWHICECTRWHTW